MIKRIILLTICLSLSLVSTVAKGSDELSLVLKCDQNQMILLNAAANEMFSLHIPEGLDGSDMIRLIHPDTMPQMMRLFRDTVVAWNQVKDIDIQRGVYSGDLFERATEKQSLELTAPEIWTSEMDAGLKLLMPMMKQMLTENTRVLIDTYDRNQWICVDLVRDEDTVLVFSADFSQQNAVRTIWGIGAEDGAYYEELNCVFEEGGRIDYTGCLYRTDAPTFRAVNEQDAVQFAEIICFHCDTPSFDFEGDIQSAVLPETAHIKGCRSVAGGGTEIVEAVLRIGNMTAEEMMALIAQTAQILLQE